MTKGKKLEDESAYAGRVNGRQTLTKKCWLYGIDDTSSLTVSKDAPVFLGVQVRISHIVPASCYSGGKSRSPTSIILGKISARIHD